MLRPPAWHKQTSAVRACQNCTRGGLGEHRSAHFGSSSTRPWLPNSTARPIILVGCCFGGRMLASALLYKKQSGTQREREREKACINTYAHASASQICLQNLCGQQQNSPMADPTFGSKSGSQNGAQAKT